jgi:sugar fermentation stimulation protein A
MLRRYQRFFADVEVAGQVVTAHCPNTGSLKSCWEVGRRAYLSPADNPERKLRWTLEITEAPTGALVGVNTSWPNKLIREAFEKKILAHWKEFESYQPEVKISAGTRLDACLESAAGKKRFVEIKNVTLVEDGVCSFPDAETTRGQKHLQELMQLKAQGFEAEIVFTVQREDCKFFRPAGAIDPDYSRLLVEAFDRGVIISVVQIAVSPSELKARPELLEFQLRK